jgi:2-hydroxy-3-keto-5-methylthiopentenyl-1-phosphate phosphatase
MEINSKSALLCDFDETVVDLDTGILILSRFADGDWRTLDEIYNAGRMPVQEVIRRQFAMVRATKKSMLDLVERSTSIRPGFAKLVKACNQRSFPVIVASYGLDFCIDFVLAVAGLKKQVKIFAPKAKITSNGIRFSFPELRYRDSANMKDDLVRHYRLMGYRIFYVGDGTSDFPAAKLADFRFAIRGSPLADQCRRAGLEFTPVTSFIPVSRAMGIN